MLEVPQMKMCSWHNPHKIRNYVKWHSWAKELYSKGHRQKQCPDCKYWFFPQEWKKENICNHPAPVVAET